MGEQSGDTETKELSLVDKMRLNAALAIEDSLPVYAEFLDLGADRIEDLENTILSDKMLKQQVNME